MSLRVLMLGPGEGLVGGISALVATLLPLLKREVDLLYFPTVRRRPPSQSGKLSVRNIGGAVEQYARFLPALRGFRPHIVHVHTSQGLAWLKDTVYVLASRAHGCKVVLHVHAADFDLLYRQQAPLIRAYTGHAMNLADRVVAVSSEWERLLASVVPIDRIVTFRNCVDTRAFECTSPAHRPGSAEALFLGSIGPRKGAFDLLEAVGNLKCAGCRLPVWVAGFEEGAGDLDWVRARSQQLHVSEMYRLAGTVSGQAKSELFRRTSIFVLPTYHEGLPMAILEAMAAGHAVVSTPVGGIPEVVKDGDNGFLIKPGDVAALAEKLALLAGDADLRSRMGQRSRVVAETELDVRPYVERLVATYRSLASGSNGQSGSRI